MQGSNTSAASRYHIAGWVAIVALTFVPTACASEATASPTPAPPENGEDLVIVLEATSFEPADAFVRTGTTVIWEWRGGVAHDVTIDTFASEIQTDGSFQHTFDKVGTYGYWCNLHPGMKGTVTVVSS